MDNKFDEIQQISKYNDGGFSISRLNDSWIACRRYIKTGNLKKWKFELDVIWLELYPDILKKTTKERNKLIEDNKNLMIKISLSKSKNSLFHNLLERHSFLRKVQDLAGKAGVYVDENEEGFE